MDFHQLHNPIWNRSDNLRDPSIFKTGEGYHLFYSRYSNKDWTRPENWSVAGVFTKDFITYENDHDISAKGFASPGDVIRWHGSYLLPYQSYPNVPTLLCYSKSEDLRTWSAPVFFLQEAASLPWNQANRVIDPTFVVAGERLHCFFVGTDRLHYQGPTNLVGHAFTLDPLLKDWTITTVDSPMIGACEEAPDGAENVTVFNNGKEWVMIYSEGLVSQHLAYITSNDLIHWGNRGNIDIPMQSWLSTRFGAPFVWKEDQCLMMILMGEDQDHHTTFGLLTSDDGIHWDILKQK